MCYTCAMATNTRAYDRAYRQQHKQRIKEYRQKRTDEQRAYLDELRQQGCMDCGNSDPRVLDFHHRDPRNGKRPALTTLVATGTSSMERIKREASSCDVVCANCHRLRHVVD